MTPSSPSTAPSYPEDANAVGFESWATCRVSALFERLQGEIVTALRGRRSQSRFNDLLGFASKRVYKIERGESDLRWPEFVHMLEVSGRNTKDLLQTFFWYGGDAGSSSALLQHVLGSSPLEHLARRSGFSRFKISRWMNGHVEPSFAEVMTLLKDRQAHLVSFLQDAVLPKRLPALEGIMRLHEAEVAITRRWPDAPAVMAALATVGGGADVGGSPDDTATAAARRLGVAPARVRRIIDAFVAAGVLVPRPVGAVGPERSVTWMRATPFAPALRAPEQRAVLLHWLDRQTGFVGRQASAPGGKSVTSRMSLQTLHLSRDDLRRLQRLQAQFIADYTELLHAATQPPEVTVVVTSALLAPEELPAPD